MKTEEHREVIYDYIGEQYEKDSWMKFLYDSLIEELPKRGYRLVPDPVWGLTFDFKFSESGYVRYELSPEDKEYHLNCVVFRKGKAHTQTHVYLNQNGVGRYSGIDLDEGHINKRERASIEKTKKIIKKVYKASALKTIASWAEEDA